MNAHRFVPLSAIGLIAILTTAMPACAQYFGGGARYPGLYRGGFYPVPPSFFGGLPPIQPVTPLRPVNRFNPLIFSPFNPSYNPQLSNAALYYGMNRLYSQSYAPPPYYSPSSSYMSGGTGITSYSTYASSYGRAQYEAGVSSSYSPRSGGKDQRALERRAAPQPPAALAAGDSALAQALAENDPALLASGDALNQLLTAAIAAQAKGGKAESGLLPPALLSFVRFAGGSNAAALNLVRAGGKPEFPAVFENAPLANHRAAIAHDLDAAIAPLLAGKPADAARVGTLEATVKKARTAVKPMIEELDFDRAIAARRFLNQMDDVVASLKAAGAAGLFDPKWTTEGVSVSDLVRHMSKYKLRFGRAADGGEEAYATLHRGLAAYLAALDRANAPKK